MYRKSTNTASTSAFPPPVPRSPPPRKAVSPPVWKSTSRCGTSLAVRTSPVLERRARSTELKIPLPWTRWLLVASKRIGPGIAFGLYIMYYCVVCCKEKGCFLWWLLDQCTIILWVNRKDLHVHLVPKQRKRDENAGRAIISDSGS